MKKMMSFLLIVLLCLSVFGCGGKENTKSMEEQLEVYWEAQVAEKDSVLVVGYVFNYPFSLCRGGFNDGFGFFISQLLCSINCLLFF